MQPLESLPFMPMPALQWQPPGLEEREATLKHQVEEFAAVLYSQMFKEMREASQSEENEGLFGGDSEIFSNFFDLAIGRTFSAREGNGLKDALYRQLSNTLQAESQGKGGSQ